MPSFIEPKSSRDRNDSIASNIALGMQKFALKQQPTFNDGASIASVSEASGYNLAFTKAARHMADFDEQSETLQWNLLAQQDSEIIQDIIVQNLDTSNCSIIDSENAFSKAQQRWAQRKSDLARKMST